MEQDAKHVSIDMFIEDTDVWLICLSIWKLDTSSCQLSLHKVFGHDINFLALLVDIDNDCPFTISPQKVNKIHNSMIQSLRRSYIIRLIHYL